MTLTSAGASPAPWRSAPAELAPREVQEGEHTSSGEDPSGPDVTPQPAFAHGRATLWLIRAHQFLRERLLIGIVLLGNRQKRRCSPGAAATSSTLTLSVVASSSAMPSPP